MKSSEIVAIVPMKPLDQAKTRLSSELTAPQRIALASNMLRHVLQAIRGLGPALGADSRIDSVWVVGGDVDVSRVASEEGVTWLEEEGSDVNETLSAAFQRAFDLDKAALFLPADLPFLKPRDIWGMVGASGYLKNVTLAPARQGGGTNGVLVPPGLPKPFRPLLGPDSFMRHLSQAASSGISVAICYSQGLAFDLDTVEDMKLYEAIAPGLLKKLTEGYGGDYPNI